MPAPLPENHYCAQCGSNGPFDNDASLKCEGCLDDSMVSRAEYQRNYQRAASAARRILIEKHRVEFDRLLFEERVRLEREQVKELRRRQREERKRASS